MTERIGSTVKEFVDGHYCIRTSSATVLPFFWFIIGRGDDGGTGQGHRRVDVLLTRRGGPHFDATESAQCIFRPQEISGAWLVRLLAKSVNATKLNNNAVPPGEARALRQGLSVLEFGGLAFWVEFEIRSIAQENLYVEARDTYLSLGKQSFCETTSGIPLDDTPASQRDRNHVHRGQLTYVYNDFDPVSGAQVMKKTLYVTDDRSLRAAEVELRTLRDPQSHPPPFVVKNSLGGSILIPDQEQTIHIDFEAGTPLELATWSSFSPEARNCINTTFLIQRLQDLMVFHREGLFHKYITPRSIRISFRRAQPFTVRTWILDQYSVLDSRIFPPNMGSNSFYLPPEGLTRQLTVQAQTIADQKLDVWMLGHSSGLCLFSHCFQHQEEDGETRLLDPRVLADHDLIIRNLRATGQLPAYIICNMIRRDVNYRPSAVRLFNQYHQDLTNRMAAFRQHLGEGIVAGQAA